MSAVIFPPFAFRYNPLLKDVGVFVPIDGFGSLKGIGGRIQKFTIEPHTNYSAENPDQYVFYKIEAKRLYNTIILPQYRNRQELDQAFNAILYNKI